MDKDTYFEKIAEMKFLTKHDIGQNFLIDSSVAENIVNLAELNENDKALEIGCGGGSLSFFLAKNPSIVDVIDIDEVMVNKVKEDFASNPNFHAIKSNALKHEMKGYTKIIGNLPYYITSGIIERVLLEAEDATKGVFMIQKEVLPRLMAKVNSQEYGPLQILLEFRGTIKREFLVPRSSFVPAPHIDSVVFTYSFKNGDKLTKAKALYSLLTKLFLHRRKTIYNNLNNVAKDNEMSKAILDEAGVKPDKRPENLTLANYLAILEAVEKKGLRG
ncbi:MAG: 16S rRNA (adenine(1518)-N(6)/adenine(1519)-N(6))-dimethyltransferase RsmA [Bacilli bacterium]|nr:16S rRNA (adenine(1518)-N(6)/adenine(1519)-N(6))-dimethyltransferase RsmA [Bacilli bacterium]